MNKIKAFINKYGIVFHASILVFWIWLLKENYDQFQIEPSTSTKISLGAAIMLIALSTFNLITAIKRLKK
jgi:hypothetical protein